MKKNINPFLINSYISKDYFCNRENELQVLQRNIENGVNTTLISPRRMGKTGLICRLFDTLDKEYSLNCIYIDVYATRNVADFLNVFAEAVMKKFPEKTRIGKQFMKLLKGLRPIFTFDTMTGYPQIMFVFQTEMEKEATLQTMLRFVDGQNCDVVIAIDEFQQIATYPEKNIEALLRTSIQLLNNTHFIFSGSQQHTLSEMFMSAKRPFYSSTRLLSLKSIEKSHYKEFITTLFSKSNKHIDEECVDYILDWTKSYTFYTQSVCNRVFSLKIVSLESVKKECLQLLRENEDVYYQYRKLLTQKQWDFLIALAKEEEVFHVYSGEFLKTYNLGNASGVRRIVSSMLEKEMILEKHTAHEVSYCVYDVFFMRWLQFVYS
jgi:uncharacterized protein